ncbi:MAG: hypothetical protein HY721_09865 [Planctomycetes bacterium]|nr:hypothetical protein [Planctomycetota bacterium]
MAGTGMRRNVVRRRLVGGALAAGVVLGLVAGGAPAAWAQGSGCTFVRGDITGTLPGQDPVVDLNDGVNILAFLFIARSVPPCIDAADINDNGLVELSDYTYLVNFLFNGGPAPPPPFPTAGTDPTPGVSVPSARDARFTFEIGKGAGVPSNTGIDIPLTLSNDVDITGITMVLKYSPEQLRIDEIQTEENTVLSAQSSEYIIAEFHNNHGVAFVAALKDFATPFSFQVGESPFLPAGRDQLVATLVCGIVVSADKGFAPISFEDGLKAPDRVPPPQPPETLPELHNLVMLGDRAVRPVLGEEGGVDIRRGFIRGDANKDDGVDISDSVWLLQYIFRGGPIPPCKDAADANNDTRLDISDPIWLLNYLFKGGPQPSEPFPQAGVDPSDDGKGSLGCASDG